MIFFNHLLHHKPIIICVLKIYYLLGSIFEIIIHLFGNNKSTVKWNDEKFQMIVCP